MDLTEVNTRGFPAQIQSQLGLWRLHGHAWRSHRHTQHALSRCFLVFKVREMRYIRSTFHEGCRGITHLVHSK
jgi:hypothetical protein